MLSRIREVAASACARPLATAERLSAATHLLSSPEYMARRTDREPGGLNDWTHTRSQVPAKTRAMQAVRNLIAREPVTQALHGSRALAAVVLISPVRDNTVRMVANTYPAGSQVLVYPRHLFGTDGSDQVSFLVQTAAALGRAGGTDANRNAAVQFIGAQTVLSNGASGWAKLPGDAWRNGDALAKIMRTQTYGDEWFCKQLDKHPAASRAICHLVLALECGFRHRQEHPGRGHRQDLPRGQDRRGRPQREERPDVQPGPASARGTASAGHGRSGVLRQVDPPTPARSAEFIRA